MNKEKIREDFKKVVDWVQENIADKCPDLIEYINASLHEGHDRGYRVLRPGVLQLKVTDAIHKGEDYSVDSEHQWVDADRAIEIASIKCIINYLVHWRNDKSALGAALTSLECKEYSLEHFNVEDPW